MTDELFLQEVKRHVHEIDPQAEVWLFGSRARGDAREDSDWDFLVLPKSLLPGHSRVDYGIICMMLAFRQTMSLVQLSNQKKKLHF